MLVAVLGTGAMGAGMARSLRRAGLDVRAWNRTPERAAPLADDGIEVSASVAEAVAGVDVVLSVLFDADAVLGVSDELTAELPDDAVWLQSSTIGVAGTARLGRLVGDTVRLVDAPVLGTKQPAAEGKLVALVSGPGDAIEDARPVLDAVATRTVVVGDELGRASALKLACNAWISSITAATAQSVALAERLQLDPKLFLEAIDGGAVNSPYAQLKGAAMLAGDFTPSFEVDGVLKDLGLILDAAKDAGVDTSVLTAVRALFARTSDDGHGGDDMAAVYTAFAD